MLRRPQFYACCQQRIAFLCQRGHFSLSILRGDQRLLEFRVQVRALPSKGIVLGCWRFHICQLSPIGFTIRSPIEFNHPI